MKRITIHDWIAILATIGGIIALLLVVFFHKAEAGRPNIPKLMVHSEGVEIRIENMPYEFQCGHGYALRFTRMEEVETSEYIGRKSNGTHKIAYFDLIDLNDRNIKKQVPGVEDLNYIPDAGIIGR